MVSLVYRFDPIIDDESNSQMLRSFIAIIAAVFVGLVTSKFVESIGQTAFGVGHDITAGAAPSAAYQFVLILGWMIAAFLSALTALFIGRRWAPLGGLAAGTVFFSALIVQLSFSFMALLTIFSAIATAIGGYAAIRLLGAQSAYPARKKQGLFND